MSFDKLIVDAPPTGDNLLNPTFIAQLASRLYNDVPGAANVPKNETDAVAGATNYSQPDNVSSHIPSPEYADPLDLTHLSNLWEHEPFQPTNCKMFKQSDHSSVPYSLDQLTENSYPDWQLPTNGNAPSAPLSVHTDNLVSQQNYSNQKDSSPSLQQFVQKVQSASGGFTDNKHAPPFYQGLSSGLPSEHFDFSFLFSNAPIQFTEQLPANEASSPYYFLREPQKPQAQKVDIFDVQTIRKDFPVLHQNIHGKPLVWFDNAATTQKPRSVIDAIAHFYATDNSNIHRGAHTLAARATDAYENARENVRRFIGAGSTSEIIFVRGTTEGINLLAQTWGRKFIQPGDEILVSLLEHHANIVPWQMLAKEKGAVLKAIPVNDNGEILMDEYARLLSPRTKLVSLTQASNGLGTILPVKEMIQLAKRYDAKVVIDGAQSVAHIPVNVQELDADFFVFSGHKIFAPTGIGVVYGKKELLEVMPPWQGGGNMIRNVTFEETTFNGLPNKFEAGTPNVADTIGLGAALDYVNRIGLKNIAEYEHKLTQYGTEQLQRIPGLRLIGTAREKVGVLSFVINGIGIEEVGKYLDQEGIAVRAGHHCTQPALRRFGVAGTVRPSLAFYNTFEEIDRMVDALKRLRAR